jgi:transmembrane sensor
MSRNQIEALLDRYLKGETSAKENELIEQWLEQNGDAHSPWQQFSKTEKDQWLADVFSAVKNTTHPPHKDNIVQLASKKSLLWRGIAAAAAVLVISFTFYLQWPAIEARLKPVQLTVFRAPANPKEITLADGSRVWINAGSELRYPKTFNGKLREVYISGEAYFDIAHNAEKPFLIHTGNIITRVLGTAFNIKEDKNKHTIEVTVTRGKVSVANGDKLLGVITRNQQISFNTVNAKAIRSDINADGAVAWRQSDLYFDDVSFKDAALQLQQHFNVKIKFANDKLENCRFTGTSLKGGNLDKILKVICAFNNATYQTMPDGSILIDGTGCY